VQHLHPGGGQLARVNAHEAVERRGALAAAEDEQERPAGVEAQVRALAGTLLLPRRSRGEIRAERRSERRVARRRRGPGCLRDREDVHDALGEPGERAGGLAGNRVDLEQDHRDALRASGEDRREGREAAQCEQDLTPVTGERVRGAAGLDGSPRREAHPRGRTALLGLDVEHDAVEREVPEALARRTQHRVLHRPAGAEPQDVARRRAARAQVREEVQPGDDVPPGAAASQREAHARS